ncbi:hypothetical protein A2U01_0031440, partial [Trifolium medium]|nr:hypothetical protein [Trifolium medium]
FVVKDKCFLSGHSKCPPIFFLRTFSLNVNISVATSRRRFSCPDELR